MKTQKTKHETRQLKDLLPADYNPRKISPEALAGLKKSIEKFGCVQPVIVNERTGIVVGGHQRIKAMMDLGYAETDVILVDLSPTEEKTLNVTLNNSAISGEWTVDVNALLDEIKSDNESLFAELQLNEIYFSIDDYKDADWNDNRDDEEDLVCIKIIGKMKNKDKIKLLCGKKLD